MTSAQDRERAEFDRIYHALDDADELMPYRYDACWQMWEAARCEERTRIKKIVENEPLGYRTEDEHAKLEAFADRILSKIAAGGDSHV